MSSTSRIFSPCQRGVPRGFAGGGTGRLAGALSRLAVKRNTLPWPGVLLTSISPPHQGDQLAADRQAQPGAAEASGDAAVGLGEGREQAFQLLALDPHAAVGDREFKAHLLRAAGEPAHADPDAALRGELDGVADQVDQDLAQAQRVAEQAFGNAVGAG